MGAPVKHTCPDIDSLIDDVKRFASDVCYELEKLRSANSSLREWGEELEAELKETNEKIADMEDEMQELRNQTQE